MNKPLVIDYTCDCGNVYSEVFYSSDKVIIVKQIHCNQCGRRSIMRNVWREIEQPIIGQMK